MSIDFPKISCLCVTNNRVEFLQRSITCFKSQKYANKELVIVYSLSDLATDEFLERLYSCDEEINLIKLPFDGQRTLGDLRNISIANSTGEYICIWDDDDWYHPDRLQIQMKEMLDNSRRASILFYLLMFDIPNKTAYLTCRRAWENSILCEKKVLSEFNVSYPSLNRGEDSVFADQLKIANVFYPIIKPQLYIYCYSGKNTCDQNHFDLLFEKGQKLSEDHSRIVADIVDEKYSSCEAAQLLASSEFISSLRYVQL